MIPNLKGKTALVTGASSGLGVDFAKILAGHGANLILVARRKDKLEEVKRDIEKQSSVSVKLVVVDLTQKDSLQELFSTYPNIDILVNNAGFGQYGDFLTLPLNKQLNMLDLNIRVLTELSYTYAARMKQKGSGYILQLASIAGFQACPLYAAYGASKSYVLHLSEALRLECKPLGITVTALCPGITQTEFLDVAGQKPTFFQNLTMMKSSDVAHQGLEALFSKKASFIPGIINKSTIFLNRIFPRFLQRNTVHFLMKN